MSTLSLQSFANNATATGRIGLGDVRRLQRDILPEGILSRNEAELLLALDRGVGCADPAWTDWLAAALVDFVVWGERPTGYVDPATAAWLTGALEAGGPATRTARLIAREITREAQGADGALVAFASGGTGAEAERAAWRGEASLAA